MQTGDRERERRDNGAAPLRASVVLPTHGRRASLVRVLRALDRQSVSPALYEVVVVCDGDVDGSVEACRAVSREVRYDLRIIEQSNAGPAEARNRGVVEARAPLIIFIDDDVKPDEHLIATHLAAQTDQESCVTIGPLLPPPDVRLNAWGQWEERTLLRQYNAMMSNLWEPTYRQFYTGNASVLKEHILAVGGFNPSFRRAEDVEMALRLRDHGLHFVFLPQARGWHYVRRSFESWVRMPAAYGVADAAMAHAGRIEILSNVRKDYRQRSLAVRALVTLCAGRPVLARAGISLLGLLARAADSMRVAWLGTAICSLIFNLQYYDSLLRDIGGRKAFRSLAQGW